MPEVPDLCELDTGVEQQGIASCELCDEASSRGNSPRMAAVAALLSARNSHPCPTMVPNRYETSPPCPRAR